MAKTLDELFQYLDALHRRAPLPELVEQLGPLQLDPQELASFIRFSDQNYRRNLVRANDQTALVTINQIMPMSVSFSVPESRLSELKRYLAGGALSVKATPPNDEGPAATGKIAFIDNAVDENSGTIRVKGTFANTDRRLWPGQYVNVVVTLTTDPKAIVVPSVAVQTGQQGTFVFVVKPDQTVEMRPVTVARVSASDTVLVSGGVQPGDTVVTDGHLRLVPGSRISVKGDNPQQATQSQPQEDRKGAP